MEDQKKMSQLRLSLLVCLFSSFYITGSDVEAASLVGRPQTKAFIEASCNGTLYPLLCIHCMSRFAHYKIDSPQQLAHIALSVSLYRAINTRTYLSKVAKILRSVHARDYQAVQDCVQQTDASIDQLTSSIKELRRLERTADVKIDDNFLWHMSNVETWVSAALTNEHSCASEFSGRRMSKLKATIKSMVLNAAQVTSNALALFHRYAAKYKAAAAAKGP